MKLVTMNGVTYGTLDGVTFSVVKVADELLAVPKGKSTKSTKGKAVKVAQTFEPIEGKFKGKATLQLTDYPHPFTFGVMRAKAILEHVERIKEFVADHPDHPVAE